MPGRIREKRPGVWEVSVEAGRDPVTRRRRQLSRTVQGTKREAQTVLNKLVSDADAGVHVGTDATFLDVAERWLSLAEADLSPTTVRRYRGLLKLHIYPTIGDRQAHKIRTSDLDDLYLGLIKHKKLTPANGPPDPRSHPQSTRPSSAVGMDRKQPRRQHHSPTSRQTQHRTAVSRGRSPPHQNSR